VEPALHVLIRHAADQRAAAIRGRALGAVDDAGCFVGELRLVREKNKDFSAVWRQRCSSQAPIWSDRRNYVKVLPALFACWGLAVFGSTDALWRHAGEIGIDG
jgi:hypothetical protein